MMDYVVASFLIHVFLIVLVLFSPKVNIPITGGATIIEVDFNTPKKQKKNSDTTILATPPKPLIPGSGQNVNTIKKKIKLEDYTDRVKSVVDPVFYKMYNLVQTHFIKKYTTEVLLFPTKSGRIATMKINHSSGNKEFDDLALKALMEVGVIPEPPPELITEGILWTFSNGGQ